MVVRCACGLRDLAHPRRVILSGHRGERGPVPAVGKSRQQLHPVGFETVITDIGDWLAVPGIVAVCRPEGHLTGRSWRYFHERAEALVLPPVVESHDDALVRKLALEVKR